MSFEIAQDILLFGFRRYQQFMLPAPIGTSREGTVGVGQRSVYVSQMTYGLRRR